MYGGARRSNRYVIFLVFDDQPESGHVNRAQDTVKSMTETILSVRFVAGNNNRNESVLHGFCEILEMKISLPPDFAAQHFRLSFFWLNYFKDTEGFIFRTFR